MITIEESIPRKSQNYLLGQDVIWTQFNEVNFYVEDLEQENFYFEILKKLFPNINFTRIFPLGGKNKVIEHLRKNTRRKKSVYLVDLDFDEILKKKEVHKNLFYLDKYSIENYLLNIDAICQFVKEQRPKINESDILQSFDLSGFGQECKDLLTELICCYLAVQYHELGIENVKNDMGRFCTFSTRPAKVITANINAYYAKVQAALKTKNTQLKLSRQMQKFKGFFRSISLALSHIPGKYLLKFLKYRIEHLFSLPSIPMDSFIYRLAKNSNFNNLHFLKNAVQRYLATA